VTKYRPWLTAAALYNLTWGTLVVLFPASYLRVIGVAIPEDLMLWRVIGMFVLVFAPGYWWAGRDPARHAHMVLIGLIGKTLGPLGFVWAFATGQLPLALGLVNLTNDLIWLPVFVLFVRDAARLSGGLRAFLAGRTVGCV
jgi:small multidrug resistance pump